MSLFSGGPYSKNLFHKILPYPLSSLTDTLQFFLKTQPGCPRHKELSHSDSRAVLDFPSNLFMLSIWNYNYVIKLNITKSVEVWVQKSHFPKNLKKKELFLFQLSRYQNHLQCLLKQFDSVGLEPENLPSNKCPGDTDAAGPGTHFENKLPLTFHCDALMWHSVNFPLLAYAEPAK